MAGSNPSDVFLMPMAGSNPFDIFLMSFAGQERLAKAIGVPKYGI
jgi:hypothetical protein